MKKYENPMLQVVSINKKDIIATSDRIMNIEGTSGTYLAPGQRGIDSWYEGY